MSTFVLASTPRIKTITATTTASTPPTTPYPPALVTAVPPEYCAMCKQQPCPFKSRTIQSHSSSDWSEED